MKRLSWISAMFLSMSFAVCGQSKIEARSLTASLQLTFSEGISRSWHARERRSSPIFVFHTDEFWLNLHHFLYVLGRAENKDPLAAREAVAAAPLDMDRGFQKLSAGEQKAWREAVTSYAAGVSKKDLIFDAPLPALTLAFARAGEAKSLAGTDVDPANAAILERVSSIYRKAWWKKHHDANREWQKSIQILVARHGAAILAFITKAYRLEWPAAGFPVHVTAYANWAGAYSTTGNLLVLSSLSAGHQGNYGLETIFHEGMHQWDDQVLAALREQALKAGKFFPKGLTHSMIFFTAGEAVRGVAPEHVPYADKFGVWQRGLSSMKVALEEVWKPYLAGQGTRDEAFAALIRRTAIEPPKK
jgi:hypothetical protein